MNETHKNFNCIIFPLTKYFFNKGKERWNEDYNPNEEVGYCGPPDSPCIDCYLCLTPVCFALDITTVFMFQCIKINYNK